MRATQALSVVYANFKQGLDDTFLHLGERVPSTCSFDAALGEPRADAPGSILVTVKDDIHLIKLTGGVRQEGEELTFVCLALGDLGGAGKYVKLKTARSTTAEMALGVISNMGDATSADYKGGKNARIALEDGRVARLVLPHDQPEPKDPDVWIYYDDYDTRETAKLLSTLRRFGLLKQVKNCYAPMKTDDLVSVEKISFDPQVILDVAGRNTTTVLEECC